LKVVVVKAQKTVECRVSSAGSQKPPAFRWLGLSCPRPSPLIPRPLSAFTLIELLVVIAILGILAGLSVPALKNIGKADANLGASRQLLDDIGRARAKAMSQRTTVYMVFIPANFWTGLSSAQTNPPGALAATLNLCDKQLTGYTFISNGRVGDQPGRHSWHYLEPWQNLPAGTFIAQQKFGAPNLPVAPVISIINNPDSPFTIYGFITNAFPFPLENSAPPIILPCIAFDSSGHLLGQNGQVSQRHEYIPLAHGTVADAVDRDKALQLSPPDITEIPPGNSINSPDIIDIDPLTGRATLQFQKVQ